MAEKTGTGVIVGRFQVVELNPVHKRLIGKVLERHEHVIIFMGSNPAPSDNNPIDLLFRLDLVEDVYGGEIEILEMPDLPDDRIWSQELDRRILEVHPEAPVTIYGTEMGFTSRYSGRHTTEILEVSAEELPDLLDANQGWDLRSFRAGMLFAAMRRFPTVYPTVDIAVLNADRTQVLVARKENETRFRFPGGFTDPSDESFEMAAFRELVEECGEIEVRNLVYLGSTRIEDWRYRHSADGIITHLYTCEFESGDPVASDDIVELRWHDVSRLRTDLFVAEHRDLWTMLEQYLAEVE